jgi:plasmid maintenance system antidote protein VapI
MIKKLSPMHPGEVLQEELLMPLELRNYGDRNYELR